MSGPADFVVQNNSNSAVTIQTQSITANGGQYSVAYGDIQTWAKDPYLNAYVANAQCVIIVLGQLIPYAQAPAFLANIAAGNIVFTS